MVIPDKFWIVLDQNSKIGTLRACESGYEFFDNRTNETIVLETFEQFSTIDKADIEKNIFCVDGYPTRYTSGIIVEHDTLPLFKKTETTKTIQAAGYYIIKTDKVGWGVWDCPTIKTLEKREYRGPYKTEWEMNLALKHYKSLST